MNKNNLIVLIVVVVLVLSGVWYFASSKTAKSPGVSSTSPSSSSTPKSEDDLEKTNNTSTESPLSASLDTSPSATPSPANTVKPDSSQTASSNEVKEFTVTALNFKYQPTQIKVKKGDRVKIKFQNAEGFHDWVLDEFNAATKKLQAGNEETIEFVASKVGTFEFYCSVGSHRQMGMVGKFIVE